MVGLAFIRRLEKRNRSNFYCRIVEVCLGSIEYWSIEAFYLLKYWNILSSKLIKIMNYIKSFCINVMYKFLSKNVSIPSTKIYHRGQNVSIPPYCILLTIYVSFIFFCKQFFLLSKQILYFSNLSFLFKTQFLCLFFIFTAII